MSRRKDSPQKHTKTDEKSSLSIQLVVAVIAASGLIIVALINRSTAITTTLKPIEFTQTAEAIHTSIAMTSQAIEVSYTFQAAESLKTSAVMTNQAFLNQVTDTPIPSVTPAPSETASAVPTEIKAVRYDYIVESGDTLKKISQKYFTVDSYADAIGKANCNQSPAVGDILVIKYYYTQQGDTIDLIASRFKSKVSFIRYVNSLSDEIILLPPSQILILPGKCGGS